MGGSRTLRLRNWSNDEHCQEEFQRLGGITHLFQDGYDCWLKVKILQIDLGLHYQLYMPRSCCLFIALCWLHFEHISESSELICCFKPMFTTAGFTDVQHVCFEVQGGLLGDLAGLVEPGP